MLLRNILKSINMRIKLPMILILQNLQNKNSTIKSLLPSTTKVGAYTYIAKHCEINAICESIGDGTYINDYTRIEFTKKIGKYCSISHNVKIGLGQHPDKRISTSPLFYSPIRGLVKEKRFEELEEGGVTCIGHDVLIGANAIILKGVFVGHGAIIGANAVVTRDVPPYSVVIGAPARIIRYRFSDYLRESLLESKWWQKTPEELKPIIEKMENPEDFLKALKLI